jgi:hypothetical protein
MVCPYSNTMSEPVLEKRSKKPGRPDYKAKLDEAADQEKNPPQEQQQGGIVDKGRCIVANYAGRV